MKNTENKNNFSSINPSSGTESVEFQRLMKDMRKRGYNIIMDTELKPLIQTRDTFSFAIKLLPTPLRINPKFRRPKI